MNAYACNVQGTSSQTTNARFCGILSRRFMLDETHPSTTHGVRVCSCDSYCSPVCVRFDNVRGTELDLLVNFVVVELRRRLGQALPPTYLQNANIGVSATVATAATAATAATGPFPIRLLCLRTLQCRLAQNLQVASCKVPRWIRAVICVCVDVVRPEVILTRNSMSGSKIAGFVMADFVDIDTPEELQQAAELLGQLRPS